MPDTFLRIFPLALRTMVVPVHLHFVYENLKRRKTPFLWGLGLPYCVQESLLVGARWYVHLQGNRKTSAPQREPVFPSFRHRRRDGEPSLVR